MNVLSIVAFHNNVVAFHSNVVSVVYDEIIFHKELNIRVVGIVRVDNVSMYQRGQRSHDKTFFQVILIISAVSVVNDEII